MPFQNAWTTEIERLRRHLEEIDNIIDYHHQSFDVPDCVMKFFSDVRRLQNKDEAKK